MSTGLHLLVPIKPLELAKTRLRGATGDLGRTHAHLVTALAVDTVSAARAAPAVTSVVVITSDPALAEVFTAEGVEVVPDSPAAGLNAALRHGEEVLRHGRPGCRLGALQADLPALRADELDAAIRTAGTGRAFCPDRQTTGTTLLLGRAHESLDPNFGPDSARAHRDSGAARLDGPWPSLRCDVDTGTDLHTAVTLGTGPRTRAVLTRPRVCRQP